MKTIKEALNKIEIEEKTIGKIGAFLKTKRGQTFVTKLNMASLKELCKRYNAPKFIMLYGNDRKDKNLIKAAVKQYKVAIQDYKPVSM